MARLGSLVLAALLTGCGAQSAFDGPTGPSLSERMVAIAVRPSNPSLSRNGTIQLEAQARDSSDQILTNVSFVWATSDPNIVSISPTGLARATGNGLATITASAGISSGSTAVRVDWFRNCPNYSC